MMNDQSGRRSLALALLSCCAMLLGNAAAEAAAEVKLVAAGVAFPEGPLWRDGKLYFVEYGASNVDVWDGNAVRPVWHEDGCGANSVTDMADGTLLVACYDAHKVVKIGLDGKTIDSFAADKNGVEINGPNDFAHDAKGGIYFTTSGASDWSAPINGKVFYMAANGTIAKVADTLHFANGLALVDGGTTLLVGEYMGGKIVAFKVNGDGSLGPDRTLFKYLSDISPTPEGITAYPGPDGIKVDSKGNIYIAQYGTGRFLIVDRQGKLLRILKVPAGAFTTNIAFGPKEEVVYVTTTYDEANAPYPGGVYQLPNQ